MITELREEVRGWLIDERVCLIGPAELIARADQAIATMEDPPDFLFSISLGESLAHVSRLDLAKEPIVSGDMAKLAGRLLELLERGDIDEERVAIVALKFKFPFHDEKSENLWREFDWITDELHLIETGVKVNTTYAQDVRSALRRAAKHLT